MTLDVLLVLRVVLHLLQLLGVHPPSPEQPLPLPAAHISSLPGLENGLRTGGGILTSRAPCDLLGDPTDSQGHEAVCHTHTALGPHRLLAELWAVCGAVDPPHPRPTPGVSVHLVMRVTTARRTGMTARTTAARMGPSAWMESTATPASVLRVTGERPREAP